MISSVPLGADEHLFAAESTITAGRHHFQSDKECTMNKDQAKGQIDQATGKIKEIAGKAVGNKELEVKGKIQNVGGKIQTGFGDLKEVLRKAGDKH